MTWEKNVDSELCFLRLMFDVFALLGVVALFTLPKVYETNKVQIDQNLDIVRGKINDLTAK